MLKISSTVRREYTLVMDDTEFKAMRRVIASTAAEGYKQDPIMRGSLESDAIRVWEHLKHFTEVSCPNNNATPSRTW